MDGGGCTYEALRASSCCAIFRRRSSSKRLPTLPMPGADTPPMFVVSWKASGVRVYSMSAMSHHPEQRRVRVHKRLLLLHRELRLGDAGVLLHLGLSDSKTLLLQR